MRDLRDHMPDVPGEPGVLRIEEVRPNPNGNIDRLFLVQGNAVGAQAARVQGAGLIPATAGRGWLRVFHFNDMHNHLTDLSGPDKGTCRFSQMVERVRDARTSSEPSDALLFLSIGDDHTGTMLDELVGWRDDQFVLDASYRAYSDGGIDATVLGNHEFDRGSALLAKGIRQDARFPILSANVHSSAHLKPGSDYSAAAIAVTGGLRIGLLGLTTHVETRVGQASDPTLAVAGPVGVVNAVLPALAPLVDVVLIMSHCGFGDGAHKSGKAAAIRDIGEADFSIAGAANACTDKPVLILGAHTHTRLNEDGLEPDNIVAGIPIFQAECNGRFLGEIKVQIDSSRPTPGTKVDTVLHPIKPYREPESLHPTDAGQYQRDSDFDLAFEARTIAPILAQVDRALNTQIATVQTSRLSFQPAVLARYASESTLVNFVCDSIHARLAGLGYDVDFALMNGATIQSGVEPGVLSAGNWFDVMPYADEIFVVQLTGAQLNDMLQSNARRILRPDEVDHTDYTGFLARGFFHTSSQVRYRIDPGASAATAQAAGITLGGKPLGTLRDREFNVIMSTYLALGGFGERWNGQPICGGVPGDLAGYDLRALESRNTGLVYRDEVAAHIRDLGILSDKDVPDRDGRLVVIGTEKAVSENAT